MSDEIPKCFQDPEDLKFKQAIKLVIDVTEYFYRRARQELALELRRVFALDSEQALALAEYYLAQFGW